MIIVRLNPAMIAYIASDVAIPKPEINPDFQFLLTVLLMHNIPKGPSGSDTAVPIIKPSQSSLKLMKANITEINDLGVQNKKTKLKLGLIFSNFIATKF